jgi:hypothetical protein
MCSRRVANDPLPDPKLLACLPWRLSEEETSILSISGPQMDDAITPTCAHLFTSLILKCKSFVSVLYFFCALSDATDRNNKKKKKANASTTRLNFPARYSTFSSLLSCLQIRTFTHSDKNCFVLLLSFQGNGDICITLIMLYVVSISFSVEPG